MKAILYFAFQHLGGVSVFEVHCFEVLNISQNTMQQQNPISDVLILAKLIPVHRAAQSMEHLRPIFT